MLDTQLQTKLAKCCADAAFGYATATAAANVAALGQVFDFWAGVARSMSPQPEPKSWYRHPDAPSTAAPAWPMWWGMPFAAAGAASAPMTPGPFGFAAIPSPAAAAKAWFDMFPLKGSPACWPMAYTMMTMGVPRTVAWPTAEANVAVIEATETARQQIKKSFASYRSTGGHATAQIAFPGQLMLAAAGAPLAAQALWPWLSGTGTG